MLTKLVYEVVQSQTTGVKHVEVVKEILRRGYKHQGEKPLSTAVYEILKKLVVCGVISRIENEQLERRYTIGAINCPIDCPDVNCAGLKELTKLYA